MEQEPMEQEPTWLERFLVDQGQAVDDPGLLRAVGNWRRAWLREWERVRALALEDEALPAPLWCWPP